MTQTTYANLRIRNAIHERDRHASDVATFNEFVTTFVSNPGVPLFDVSIRPAFDAGELIVTLAHADHIEQRTMPDQRYTYKLAAAYAAFATHGLICAEGVGG